jgi:CXXC-20-CXXC protein
MAGAAQLIEIAVIRAHIINGARFKIRLTKGKCSMKLPVCCKCHYSFRWRSAIKVLFGWKRFICPHCKTKLYPTAESRQKASFANSLSLLVLLLLPSFGVSFLWTFIIYFVLLASILALLPFFYTFADQEEPFW